MSAALVVTACVPRGRALRQHRVRVVDAETATPLSGATVDLHVFPSAPEMPDPGHLRVTTSTQGELTIRSEAEPAIWQVRAEGYIEQRLTSSAGHLPPRYAAHATSAYDGIVHLYRMPEPRLAVQVSETYAGPLTIHLQPARGFGYVLVDEINVAFAAVDPQASYVQHVPGHRSFVALASAEGVVELVVAPLLYDIETRQLQVRDGDDVLPYRDIANPQDVGRGVWGSISQDDKRLHRQIRLFVGTLRDYREYLGPLQ